MQKLSFFPEESCSTGPSLVGKAWEDDSDLHMLVHVIPHLGSNKTLKTYLLKLNWKKWIVEDQGTLGMILLIASFRRRSEVVILETDITLAGFYPYSNQDESLFIPINHY